jgi:phage terminase Nu1 subunit (DNA packaging protein)
MNRTKTEFELLTGFDRRRIAKALVNLRPSKERGARGAVQYDSTRALPLLYRPSKEGSYDLTQERARLAHHQANKAEQEVAEQIAGLVSIADIAGIYADELATVRAKLLGLPTRLAPQLLGTESAAEIQHTFDNGIREVLKELTADTA